LLFIGVSSFAQDISKRLQAAARQFQSDSQMRHAIYSLYVIDAKTGKVVFDKNSQVGLAPASCQKLFTSGAAFELLGHEYKYKTTLAFTLDGDNKSVRHLVITGSGDPSLGSWRFRSERQVNIFDEWINALKANKISSIKGTIIPDDSKFEFQVCPGGWIYDDIGNYYGAGAAALNWRENQFDLILRSGSNIGDVVRIIDKVPVTYAGPFINELKTAEEGSGDNAYIYPPTEGFGWLVKGTIPVGENHFVISGAILDPVKFVVEEFKRKLDSSKISYWRPGSDDQVKKGELYEYLPPYYVKDAKNVISQHLSPTFDTLNFWFLRRSINLYGEAFVKTIALEKKGFASTEDGVELVKDFWSQQGIDKAAINIIDGSGLSPQNRVTTNALVRVLQYAKTRPWYNSFYLSLPTYNGMKMKSGSIGGARSFAGYEISKDGHQYIFAIIVNNYDGSSSTIVNKMYKVLDNLK